MVDSTLSVARARIRYPWMFGRTVDVSFFFLPIAFGFLLYACLQATCFQSAFWLVLIINAFGAGPFHQGATLFAYLDERNRNEFGSTPGKRVIFFLAPIAIVALSAGMAVAPQTYPLLVAIWTLWSLQHLVQQNVGILLLYHNHGKQEAIVPKPLEVKSLQISAVALGLIFFHRVILRGAAWEIMIPLIAAFSILSLWLVCQYLFSLASQYKAGAYLNMPALMFWFCSIAALSPLAFMGQSFSEGYMIPITAHWFQYIALNYVLVKNKYKHERVSALPFAKPIVLFVALCAGIVALMLGLAMFKAMTPDSFVARLLAGVLFGFGNAHYFLDAFMWRFREPVRRAAVLPYLLAGR